MAEAVVRPVEVAIRSAAVPGIDDPAAAFYNKVFHYLSFLINRKPRYFSQYLNLS